jgi:asparagine synthase (glutamine-hydrolysing)
MREIDLDTIRLSLLVRLWLPADRTFFRGIEPVLPGTYVTVFAGGVTTTRYAHTAEPTHMDAVSEEGAIALFTERLNAAVKKRLKARVPIAAFLSGGIDSSYVCAIANRNMSEPLRTFTISYEGDENIDLDYARLMSKEHQLSHRNVIVGAHDYSIQNIDLVTYHVEEVLIDQVYIPMYLNFQAAKCEGYTVVLTGEGADEAWAGYLNARRIFRDVRSRKSTQQLRETYLRDVLFGNKLRPDFIGTDCSVELLEDYFDDHIRDSHEESQVNSYSRYAERTILHNLLLQVDKLSMANAVECRAPFVDRALFELSHATPGELKIRDGREKYVIRRSAIGALPEAIVARRKNGFPEPPLPYGRWIRDICIDAWEQISESPLLNRMLDRASLASPRVFSEYELWILLALFRFEAVFGVGICDSHS